ncbi:MAG TPA: DUF2341 domain-containing protein, partial [Thermoproteales archaeon]|nr:DUF2341 domain-containing protein [Thermoproteales archaeon]
MGWYDSGWSYRKEVTIDNTSNSNNLIDYQVKVTLNSTNFDFSKAKSDGADIRFTDDDGTTLLNHWIEKWDASGEEAIIWVKVPSIPASSNRTIYLYYGNSNASSTSNGDDTFDFFDDFLGTSIDSNKWNTVNGGLSYSITDGILRCNGSFQGSSSGDGGFAGWQSKTSFGLGRAIRGKIKVDHGQAGYYNKDEIGFGKRTYPVNTEFFVDVDQSSSNSNGVFSVGNGSSSSNTSWSRSTIYNIWDMIRYPSGNCRAIVGSVFDNTFTSNTPSGDLPVTIGRANWATDNVYYDFYIDWILVRKFSDPEPSTTVGNEETNFCISGQVTLNGNPVQGAIVRAICQDDETYAGDTTTDENGNYSITNLK